MRCNRFFRADAALKARSLIPDPDGKKEERDAIGSDKTAYTAPSTPAIFLGPVQFN